MKFFWKLSKDAFSGHDGSKKMAKERATVIPLYPNWTLGFKSALGFSTHEKGKFDVEKNQYSCGWRLRRVSNFCNYASLSNIGACLRTMKEGDRHTAIGALVEYKDGTVFPFNNTCGERARRNGPPISGAMLLAYERGMAPAFLVRQPRIGVAMRGGSGRGRPESSTGALRNCAGCRLTEKNTL